MTLDQFDPDDRGFDAFNNPITGVRNEADLPAHYNATPQRYRLFVDGSRVNWYYSSVSQTALDPSPAGDRDIYKLTPDAGQTVLFETAERFRYVVGYESEATLALATNQELQGNDVVRAFVGNKEGYHFTFTPSGCTISIERDSSTTVVAEDVPTAVALTVFSRLVLKFNWYNVGRSRFERTFSRNGAQFQPKLGDLSADGGRGPKDINVRIGVEVTTDAATTGLEVYFGSVGYSTLADVERSNRPKTFLLRGMSHSGSNQYEPLCAFRHKPNVSDENVVIELDQVEVLTSPATAEITVQSIDRDLVAADFSDPEGDGSITGPVAPDPVANYNVPFDYTKVVTEFPDETGTVQTGSPPTATHPGGYQIGGASATSSGGNTRDTSGRFLKQMHDEDYSVVLAQTDSSSTDFDLEFELSAQY